LGGEEEDKKEGVVNGALNVKVTSCRAPVGIVFFFSDGEKRESVDDFS
jgi:hypothetical protein